MSVAEIIELVILGLLVLAGILAIVVAIIRGDMKKFIEEKMVEAEELYKDLPQPEKSKQKLTYVLQAVKEKYKLMELFINAKKFIEHIIDLSKQINAK